MSSFFKVKRVLPSWLSQPSVVSSNIKVDRIRVEKVAGLDEQMVRLLRSNGIKKFFPGRHMIVDFQVKNWIIN